MAQETTLRVKMHLNDGVLPEALALEIYSLLETRATEIQGRLEVEAPPQYPPTGIWPLGSKVRPLG